MGVEGHSVGCDIIIVGCRVFSVSIIVHVAITEPQHFTSDATPFGVIQMVFFEPSHYITIRNDFSLVPGNVDSIQDFMVQSNNLPTTTSLSTSQQGQPINSEAKNVSQLTSQKKG